MKKYLNDILIPESIIRILNRHQIELNLNDKERCEEDMYSESVIIPFSLLFDVDLACIKLVQELYNKVPFWNDNINKTDNELRKLLLEREDENPLTILHEPNKTIDNLYKSLIEQNYGKIIGIAINLPTALYDLAYLMSKTNDTSITIYCDACPIIDDKNLWNKISALEKTGLTKSNNSDNFKIVTSKLRGCEAYKEYTVIFYKYSSELDKDYITQYSSDYAWGGKSILCANYNFNIDKNTPSLRMDIVLKTGISNNIGLTTIYRDKDLQ